MKLPSEWSLMKQGSFELAYTRMTESIAREPKLFLRHGYNRGLCLLNLKKPELALLDFQKLIELRPNSASAYIGAGVALWCLDQKEDAIHTWKSSIDRSYADAAGGIMGPALLFFAACQMRDLKLEKDAIQLLKIRYKTRRASAWPGPIAGFLLNVVTKEELLEKVNQRPALQSRMITKAHFWIGVSFARQKNTEGYYYHLHQAGLGHILEPEYYLAKYELGHMN